MTIEVKIIADTLHPQVASARITTFQVYAPRFLLAELNTHRVLSRSAASSRAIPVAKRIASVRDDPFVPSTFGKNKKGMSADEDLLDAEAAQANNVWRGAVSSALDYAEIMDKLGVHKQQANRLLEPYAHFYGVITATEWDNFWNLRISKAAQPEFVGLATEMKRAYDASNGVKGYSHIPYNVSFGVALATALQISSARCARSSYKTQNGKESLLSDDVELGLRLKAEGHLSPFDHPAIPDTAEQRPGGTYTPRPPTVRQWFWSDPESHRQYWGWIPHRVSVEKELGITCRRSSFQPIGNELVT